MPSLGMNLVGYLTATCLIGSCVPVHAFPTCPGTFDVAGVGQTHLIPTGWPSVAAPMEISGNKLVATHGGRAYFADNCTAGSYRNDDYAAFNLLGSTMQYTVDLAGAGCGCNVAFYLTSMRQNRNPSACNDYYCDANDVCGESCSEIDIMEANTKSWHSTLHTQFDHSGFGGGYGGGDGWNGPRDWTQEQYSEGGSCIDTSRPFQVSVSFPTDASGGLEAMDIKLSQDGSKCPLSLHLSDYTGKTELGQALKNGMTPVFSYWSSDKMMWMDGKGQDGLGPCASDPAQACQALRPTVSDFSVTSHGTVKAQPQLSPPGLVQPQVAPSVPPQPQTSAADPDSDPKTIWERLQPTTPQPSATMPQDEPQTVRTTAKPQDTTPAQKQEPVTAAPAVDPSAGYKPLTDTCPEPFDVPGLGKVSMVLSGMNSAVPRSAGAAVLVRNNTVAPQMLSRAYFADTCTTGQYNNEQYKGVNFLGKKLSYSVDLSGAYCGCSASLQLVSMRQNTQPSACGDYYCNANSLCGVPCAEIDIQEANAYAWQSILHSKYDHSGLRAGYGGGDGVNGPRDWPWWQYGPGGKSIDTASPFNVEVSFPMNADGGLKAMIVNLTQAGKEPLSIKMGNYQGSSEISAALFEGMTPVISYYSSDSLLWLDGRGIDNLGPCHQDIPSRCSESVQFSGFRVDPLEVSKAEIEFPKPKTAKGTCVDGWIVKPECKQSFWLHEMMYAGCTSVEAKGKHWCSHDEKYSGSFSWCEPCSEVIGGTSHASLPGQEVATQSEDDKVGASHQCGGRRWTGPTTCDDGLVCQFMNEWYSECMPFIPDDNCFKGWMPPQECARQFMWDDTEFVGCSTADSRFDPPRGWCSLDMTFKGHWMDCMPCADPESPDNTQVILKKDSLRGGVVRGLGRGERIAVGRGIAATLGVAIALVAVLGALVKFHRHRMQTRLVNSNNFRLVDASVQE